MSDAKTKDVTSTTGQGQAGARRAYQAPAVLSEEVFETMALSCSKANAFQCPGGSPDRS